MYLKNNLITFTLYFFVTFILIKLFNDPNQAIFIWPAVGIGIITALVWGYQVIPGLFLAQFTINYLLFQQPDSDNSLLEFAITGVYTLAALFRCYFGALLIKNFIGYPNALISFRVIFRFFFIVGPVATLVSTIVFEFTRYALGYIDTISYSQFLLDWWLGDLLGFSIFAPLTLILIAQPISIWRPRYLTVGLPIIVLFISVILIYNKSHENDLIKINTDLKIKNELVVTKMNQHFMWIKEVENLFYSHLLPKGNETIKVDTLINSIRKQKNASQALVVLHANQTQYIKTDEKLVVEEFNKIKELDFIKMKQDFLKDPIQLSKTRYIKEIEKFVNIFQVNFEESQVTLYVFHDFTAYLTTLMKQYKMLYANISLKLDNQTNSFPLFETKEKLPENEVNIQSKLLFLNEEWTLIYKPTNRYFIQNQSKSSSTLAKIGFLFAALIGITLLIITGKTTLTDIEVNERTLDLDTQANDLRSRKKQYQALIEQHPVILWRQKISDNKMVYISSKVEGIYGYPLEDWLTKENFWLDHIHEDDIQKVTNTIHYSLQNNIGFELEYRLIKADQSIAWIKDVVNINQDKEFNTILVGLMADVSETHEARQNQSFSESKYRTLFKHAIDPLIIIDLDDNSIKEANDKAIDLFGLNNIIGHITLADFSPIYQPDGGKSKKSLRKIFNNLNKIDYFNFEWTMRDKAHHDIICNIELIKLPNQDYNIVLANINDITEKKLHDKKINQLAYYDNLTKLPNREYFYSKFEYFHQFAKDNDVFGSIIYLDLDRFKLLNDSLGHQAGDELLKMVATRIRTVSKKNDFCARLGGDEFIILNKKFEKSLESLLENSLVKSELILEALNKPYQLGDYEHYITPSIGISYFPSDHTTIDQIIHQADIAMYASKGKGKNTITIYQPNMIQKVGKRLKIEKAIKQAFEHNEFKLYYQSQVNENSETISVEALLRWDKSDELGINTEVLIETIEQIGLIHELGHWVFDQACSQLAQWIQQGTKIKSIAINVSAKQFHQKLFTQQVVKVIKSYQLDPSQIVIELTEAVIIDNMVSLIAKLNELREYGIRISLDDFGTGYSSMAYLKHLPINQLKIDKLFIHDLSFDKSSQHILKTIIDLARLMEFELVAEGVEIKDQFDILKQLGCKRFQGFYFSKPKSGNELV
jgi:diguanylate cyclase (GGDEF)-like protein/PAS domain S-box-containing protein